MADIFFFSFLPTELRLKIFSHTLPRRILQLGVTNGAPFPIPFYDPLQSCSCRVFRDYMGPVQCTLPVAFHICHESRQLCLSIYVPFSYTYIHPSLDILYISKRAVHALHLHVWDEVRKGNFRDGARPPLYPLGLLDTVAVEFDRPDLHESYLKPLRKPVLDMNLGFVFEAFRVFGPPRKLLLVRGAEKFGSESFNNGPIYRWKRIKLVEWEEDEEWSDIAVDFVQRGSEDYWSILRRIGKYDGDGKLWFVEVKENNFWMGEKLPEVGVVGLWAEDQIDMRIENENEKGKALYRLGASVAKEWIDKEFEIHDRQWDLDLDGSLYSKENIARALERARKCGV